MTAGGHEVVVDLWDHPNVYRMKLDAKPGMLYTLEVTARGETAVAGMFGMAPTPTAKIACESCNKAFKHGR